MGRMNLKGITLSEISQVEKDKQQMNDLMYIWNIKKKKSSQIQRTLVVGRGGKGVEGWAKWMKEVKRYKL